MSTLFATSHSLMRKLVVCYVSKSPSQNLSSATDIGEGEIRKWSLLVQKRNRIHEHHEQLDELCYSMSGAYQMVETSNSCLFVLGLLKRIQFGSILPPYFLWPKHSGCGLLQNVFLKTLQQQTNQLQGKHGTSIGGFQTQAPPKSFSTLKGIVFQKIIFTDLLVKILQQPEQHIFPGSSFHGLSASIPFYGRVTWLQRNIHQALCSGICYQTVARRKIFSVSIGRVALVLN